jgi:hypothetical protein
MKGTPVARALPNFRRRDIHSPSVQHDRGWKVVARHSTDGANHRCLFDSPPRSLPDAGSPLAPTTRSAAARATGQRSPARRSPAEGRVRPPEIVPGGPRPFQPCKITRPARFRSDRPRSGHHRRQEGAPSRAGRPPRQTASPASRAARPPGSRSGDRAPALRRRPTRPAGARDAADRRSPPKSPMRTAQSESRRAVLSGLGLCVTVGVGAPQATATSLSPGYRWNSVAQTSCLSSR